VVYPAFQNSDRENDFTKVYNLKKFDASTPNLFIIPMIQLLF